MDDKNYSLTKYKIITEIKKKKEIKLKIKIEIN